MIQTNNKNILKSIGYYKNFFRIFVETIYNMGLINISKLVQAMGKETGGNSYSYLRITNLLNGIKGNSSKRDIQQIRRVLNKELTSIDRILEKLENQE